MILIDTSAWIEFFKGKSKTADIVEDLLDSNQAALCGPVLTELGRGFASEKEKARVLGFFSGCHELVQPRNLWVDAGELGALLRKKGRNIKTVDLFIGVYALAHAVPLLTLDTDFASMKKCGIPIMLYG